MDIEKAAVLRVESRGGVPVQAAERLLMAVRAAYDALNTLEAASDDIALAIRERRLDPRAPTAALLEDLFNEIHGRLRPPAADASGRAVAAGAGIGSPSARVHSEPHADEPTERPSPRELVLLRRIADLEAEVRKRRQAARDLNRVIQEALFERRWIYRRDSPWNDEFERVLVPRYRDSHPDLVLLEVRLSSPGFLRFLGRKPAAETVKVVLDYGYERRIGKKGADDAEVRRRSAVADSAEAEAAQAAARARQAAADARMAEAQAHVREEEAALRVLAMRHVREALEAGVPEETAERVVEPAIKRLQAVDRLLDDGLVGRAQLEPPPAPPNAPSPPAA